MTNTTSYEPSSSTEAYKIGSFKLNDQSLEHVKAAIGIAKRMRRGKDGGVEDAARAIVMLFGAALWDDEWFEVQVKDEEDMDQQVVAYMDGVAELQNRFTPNHGPLLCSYRYVA